MVEKSAMDASRDAVRLAAIRELMRTALDPEEPLSDAEHHVAALLTAGYGVRDICAALGLATDAVQGMLVRLAR